MPDHNEAVNLMHPEEGRKLVAEPQLPREPLQRGENSYTPATIPIFDANGDLIAWVEKAYPWTEWLIAAILAAPATARRLAKVEQAARKILNAWDRGRFLDPPMFEALRLALEGGD